MPSSHKCESPRIALTVDLPTAGIDQRLTFLGFSRYGVMQSVID
jgi:hypothetical protein